MSLLTSPNTTRQHLKFFNKMDKQFQKRSFSNMNYVEPTNIFKQINETVLKAEEQIRQELLNFIERLRHIVENHKNIRVDYYMLLTQMKNLDFFNEVALIIKDDIFHRIHKIDHELDLKKQQIRFLKKYNEELKSQIKKNNSKEASSFHLKNIKFNGVKSISENIYEKAKILNEEEFTEMCNKVLQSEKIIINKIQNLDLYKNWNSNKLQHKQEKELLKKIDQYITKEKQNPENPEKEQFINLILNLRKITQPNSNKQEKNFICMNPCCKIQTENDQFRQSKAHLLIKTTDSKRFKEIYKNNRTEEYFSRYYRKGSFDVQKITSVQRTKREEMQKLEDDYRKNIKMRKKAHNSMSKP